ncbi:MAG: phosphoglycerate dehydrogenase [Deferribacteraceae bacterium]|nr:phosphoglycerate dehydrogenase [Deferribacteraceae bacterium]
MKILVTATSFNPKNNTPALARLSEFADEIIFNPMGRPLTEDELIPLLADCDGYIAGLDFITDKVLAACGKLKVISRYGVGVDRVDLEAAKACGIKVCNTPGANLHAVADLAFSLILSVARRIPTLDSKTRAGQWPRSMGTEVYGKTIGILGLGSIGKAVAKRAQGFDMAVMAYDPYINEQYTKDNNITAASLDEVLRQANIISLHLPYNDETKNILNREAMQTMKQGAIIVNTARGGLIDEAAAYELLESGHLGGLGLDVYEKEPPSQSPLFGLPNTVLLPHTASHTLEAVENMSNMSVQNLIDVLSGKACSYTVV